MRREDFLARVRQATATGRTYGIHVRDDIAADVGYIGGGDDLVQRMADEVVVAGGESEIVNHSAEAVSRLGELLDKYDARVALCWEHPVLERAGVGDLLRARGVQIWSHEVLAGLSQDEQRRRMLNCELGISSTTYAVAETGTLAVCSGPRSERLATLLPPVHVAVVEEKQILPDLFDLFVRLDPSSGAEMPTNVSLITGPSKTGDLELRLTTGVHGPRHWHVIIVRSSDSDA